MDIKEFLRQKLKKILRVGPLTFSGTAGLFSQFIKLLNYKINKS
jgi:hypothetical protein